MQDLQSRIRKIFQSANPSSPKGYALGIYQDGAKEFIFEGKASIEHDVAIDGKTKFHIASLTKHFVAEIFRYLERKGVVSEHDDLRKYFSEIDSNLQDVKIKHLLNHTSGLRDQWELTEYAGWRPQDVITNDDILQLLKRQTVLNFHPESHYAYNNTGYTLLSIILEKVTGETIQKLTTDYLFEQYGTVNTGYYSYKDSLDWMATPYVPKPSINGQYEISRPNFDVTGSTSMYSTIEDLISIEETFYKTQVGLPSIERKELLYHDGLMILESNGLSVQMHSGWDYGYSAFLLRILSSKVSIVILSNYGVSNLFPYAMRVAALIDGSLSKATLIKHNLEGAKVSYPNPDTFESGWFLNKPSNIIFEVDSENALKIQGNNLFQIDDKNFLIQDSLTQIESVSSTCFNYVSFGLSLQFTKLTREQIAFSLKNYEGTYYSVELDAKYSVALEQGALVLLGRKFVRYNLRQVTNEYFITPRFTLKFIVEEDRILGFILSNQRMWNLSFQKLRTS
ncbi:serine hydrolase [Mucilaginibacter sp. PAMB04274]|uniref:serine hydrolase domain-containing protein n=1 Tax=Mucilaginibacter sp. PAMB04274 TaxID=3138568 RepID=UPI0031F69D73